VRGEKVNFIILYEGRAGSSYLVDALNRHPDITANGEILNRESHWLQSEPVMGVARLHAVVERSVTRTLGTWQVRRAQRFYGNPTRRSTVVGFKIKVRRIVDLNGMKQVLENNSVRTMVMARRNLVKLTIAHLYGIRLFEKTKHKYASVAWNLFDENDRLGPQNIEFEEFDKMLRRVIWLRESLHVYARSLSVPRLDLEYSDLLRDKDGWFQSIFDFLDVEPPRQLDSRVLQNEPDDLRQAVGNFEELKSHYKGTAFEAMFEEVV
jgi:hypothetical protein